MNRCPVGVATQREDLRNFSTDGLKGKVASKCTCLYMDVSQNGGSSPQIIHFSRVFHCKPSFFGVPLFLETPISCGWKGAKEPQGISCSLNLIFLEQFWSSGASSQKFHLQMIDVREFIDVIWFILSLRNHIC